MAFNGHDVYATLLLNDFYLPGALVLAHSLLDAGTTKKLAVLITADTVSVDAVAELRKLFHFVIPVERVVNDTPANLYLMDRPDLHSTFTKITLWKQIQFRRIVYVDADMIAIRAPDELFDLPHAFSAAPDIGWPDLFNTGLMVLNPSMGEYYALLAMAQRGISFDGADQGLLNMHFKTTYNRLSFTYNVTPSAHYQYLPAYRHFQSSISMGHFIGLDKPWTQGRDANRGSTPYDEMIGRWWAVYDRHYRESSAEPASEPIAPLVQYYVKGEFQPVDPNASSSQPSQREGTETLGATREHHAPLHAAEQERLQSNPAIGYPSQSSPVTEGPFHETPRVKEEESAAQVPAVKTEEQKPHYSSWDASKAPPPADSQPEAHNFPATHYTMSSDPTPFKAPERYPDPPKGMYYEVPKTPTYQKPAPIFPWEKNASKPTRVFPDDDLEVIKSPKDAITSPVSTAEDKTPTFPRVNAWDEVPEIERYIGNLQKNRKGKVQVLRRHSPSMEEELNPEARAHGLKLTDFPTELERPSLPVTPAPIRRPSFWGEERDEDGELPAADGVPSQEDWDPAAQLEQLARRQSDVLASKLGKINDPPREIPLRPLPYGSEPVISHTNIARRPPVSGSAAELAFAQRVEEPSYKGPSAAWDKDETLPTQETSVPPSEEPGVPETLPTQETSVPPSEDTGVRETLPTQETSVPPFEETGVPET